MPLSTHIPETDCLHGLEDVCQDYTHHMWPKCSISADYLFPSLVCKYLTHVHAWLHVTVYVCINIFIFTFIYIYVNINMYTQNEYIYIIYMCIYIYVHIYIYIYIKRTVQLLRYIPYGHLEPKVVPKKIINFVGNSFAPRDLHIAHQMTKHRPQHWPPELKNGPKKNLNRKVFSWNCLSPPETQKAQKILVILLVKTNPLWVFKIQL